MSQVLVIESSHIEVIVQERQAPEIPKRSSSTIVKTRVPDDDRHPPTSTETERNSEFTVSRGVLDPDSKRSYDGVITTNTFKVNKPIVLCGVSFFGPHQKYIETSAIYKTSISLQESDAYKGNRKKFQKLQRINVLSERVERGEKFRVNFTDRAVLIPKNVWFDIKFDLNGPPTGHMDLKKIKTEVVLTHQGKHLVKFDFFVGSCQMPDLHFIVP